MTTTKQFQLGSISTGTHPEHDDSLIAFANSLEAFGSHDELVKEIREAVAQLELVRLNNGFGSCPDTPTLVEELIEALNSHCPPFVTFGAHPGDGADFGFWPDWGAINDFEEGDVYFKFNGYDVTCLDHDNNILWSTV